MTPIEDILLCVALFMTSLAVMFAILGLLWYKAEKGSDKEELVSGLTTLFLGATLGVMFVLGLFVSNGYTIGG